MSRAPVREQAVTVSRPHDADEREAQSLAARALAGPVRSATLGQSALGHGAPEPTPAVAERVQSLDESGEPLPAGPRAFFESRFGHSFAHVRVHADAHAGALAHDLEAQAFAVGRHIGFSPGTYQPSSRAGRGLLAHELAHVVQSDQGASTSRIRRDLVYGSGYANRFASQADEADASTAGEWFPASVDFAETARRSGGGTGNKTLAGLLATVGAAGTGTIKQLGLIGHANPDALALAGTITKTSVTGAAGAMIDDASLKKAKAEVDKVRDRFAADGRITLFGCNSGASGALLDAISNAFGVCAEGFKDEITWCIKWTLPAKRIVQRGKTAINPPSMDCDTDFNESVLTLTPDKKSCVGGPAKP